MVGGFGAAACFGFVDLPEGTQPLIQDTRAPTAPRARRVHLCVAAGPAGPGRFFRLGPLRFDDTVSSFDPFAAAWQCIPGSGSVQLTGTSQSFVPPSVRLRWRRPRTKLLMCRCVSYKADQALFGTYTATGTWLR